MYDTPTYIKSLVIPLAKTAKTSRRVWSIDLETVWLPFFHATNVSGDTALPSEALGAPLRLGISKDGAVKFSQSGRPVVRVVKDISDMVRLIRDNFTATLSSYANGVITENPEAYEKSVTTAIEAGKPIMAHDSTMLAEAVEKLAEAREAQASVKRAEATTEAAKSKKHAAAPAKEPELVSA